MHQHAESTPQEKHFRTRVPLRLELAEVKRLVAPRRNDARVMLDIGFASPVVPAALRAGGGVWCTIARSPEDADDFSKFLGSPVYCMEAGGAIPFEAHSFDVVVVALDILAVMGDAEPFLRECNRVLKSAGEVLITTQFRKRLSVMNFFRRRVAQAAGDAAGAVAAHSLTESEIYRMMKPGFDVLGVSYFCGFFTELARLCEARFMLEGRPEEIIAASMRWRYWLAQQLDFFTMLTRGYAATVRARRRRWRDRVIPVLTDGRTIQEAVLMPEG